MLEFPVDGRTGVGYFAAPASGNGPGVLVLHAWWGLTPFFKEVCDRLAGEGFVAFAPDLYHGRTAATIDEAKELQSTLDGDETYKEISAAIEHLLAHEAVQGSRIGVVGFSMGGAWALMLEEHIGAVVVFYGTTDPKYVSVDAAILGHFAEQDEFDPREEVLQLEQAIRAGGRDVTFHFYPEAQHWFFESDRPGYYHADAAGLAWQRTVEFLRKQLATA